MFYRQSWLLLSNQINKKLDFIVQLFCSLWRLILNIFYSRSPLSLIFFKHSLLISLFSAVLWITFLSLSIYLFSPFSACVSFLYVSVGMFLGVAMCVICVFISVCVEVWMHVLEDKVSIIKQLFSLHTSKTISPWFTSSVGSYALLNVY